MMIDAAAVTGNDTVTLVRSFPGPIERVWAYLTQPELLATWLSGGRIAGSVGGVVQLDMGPSGRVTVWDPPHVLEYTWTSSDAACSGVVDSLVRWELAGDGGGVRLTLTHSRLPESGLVPHAAGWQLFAERLEACLDDREPVAIEPRFEALKAEYAKRYHRVH